MEFRIKLAISTDGFHHLHENWWSLFQLLMAMLVAYTAHIETHHELIPANILFCYELYFIESFLFCMTLRFLLSRVYQMGENNERVFSDENVCELIHGSVCRAATEDICSGFKCSHWSLAWSSMCVIVYLILNRNTSFSRTCSGTLVFDGCRYFYNLSITFQKIIIVV